MLNAIKAAMTVRWTVRNIRGFFGCSGDVARMYFQTAASAEMVLELNQHRLAIDWSID